MDSNGNASSNPQATVKHSSRPRASDTGSATLTDYSPMDDSQKKIHNLLAQRRVRQTRRDLSARSETESFNLAQDAGNSLSGPNGNESVKASDHPCSQGNDLATAINVGPCDEDVQHSQTPQTPPTKKRTSPNISNFDPTKYGLLNQLSKPTLARDSSMSPSVHHSEKPTLKETSPSSAHSGWDLARNPQSLENNQEQMSPSRISTTEKTEALQQSINESTSEAKPATALNGRAKGDKAPKDVSAIKEMLEKEREKKLTYYSQAAIQREAEKDTEASDRLQKLHKARAAPSTDLHLLPNTTFSYSNNILEVARAGGNVDTSKGRSETKENDHSDGTKNHITPSKMQNTARGKASMTGNLGEDANEEIDVPSEGSLSEDTVHGQKTTQAVGGPQFTTATLEGNLSPASFEWGRHPLPGSDPRMLAPFLNKWVQDVVNMTPLPKDNLPRHNINEDAIKNPDLLPDGLSLVPREQIVFSVDDSYRFGYGRQTFHHTDLTPAKFNKKDWEDWGRLEETDPQNAQHKDETAAMLCSNLLAHLAKEQVEKVQRADQARRETRNNHLVPVVQSHVIVPKTNIYIRPAVISDVPQVLNIFNSHIEHSARTSELEPILLNEMQNRLADAETESLPFLVAALKEFKSLKKAKARTPNLEKVVGFGAGTLFSPADQAEQYTAELEIYVHREWLRRGIGSCLLDKILETADPGYIPRQGYFFTCDEASRRRYGPGGIRNLLSTLFVVRHYDKPVSGEATDYNWVKRWLEEFAFREKGYLDQVGMRNGRIVNTAYLVRRTAWEPSHKHVGR